MWFVRYKCIFYIRSNNSIAIYSSRINHCELKIWLKALDELKHCVKRCTWAASSDSLVTPLGLGRKSTLCIPSATTAWNKTQTKIYNTLTKPSCYANICYLVHCRDPHDDILFNGCIWYDTCLSRPMYYIGNCIYMYIYMRSMCYYVIYMLVVHQRTDMLSIQQQNKTSNP
jgi:hypothetical protein